MTVISSVKLYNSVLIEQPSFGKCVNESKIILFRSSSHEDPNRFADRFKYNTYKEKCLAISTQSREDKFWEGMERLGEHWTKLYKFDQLAIRTMKRRIELYWEQQRLCHLKPHKIF